MFGQLVIGPSGSGKSTFCNGMFQLMKELRRPVAIVNLDPLNDCLQYECAVDIRNIVDATSYVEDSDLGPNATQLYLLDVLATRLDRLETELRSLGDVYVLFDCPGQFELYTDSTSMVRLVEFLTRKMKFQLVAVTLIDCLLCTSSHSFISAVMLSLSMMINLELPHVNVLSKMDKMREVAPEMAFNLEFYLRAGDGNMEALVQKLFPASESTNNIHPLDRTYGRFISSISAVIEEYSLVGFVPLAIEDKESALHVLSVCDKANGYTYSAEGFHLLDEAQKEDVLPVSEYFTGLEEKFQKGPFCTACGKDAQGGKLMNCSACRKAQYCDRACQKADWSYHKTICNYKQCS